MLKLAKAFWSNGEIIITDSHPPMTSLFYIKMYISINNNKLYGDYKYSSLYDINK